MTTDPMPTQPDLINYADASAMLDLSVGTLRSLVSRGQIPHVRLSGRIVRFSRAGLQAWVFSHTLSPGDILGGKGVDHG